MSDYTYSSIPRDIGLKIASSLEVPDISSLSCCSRVWYEICDSDCLWEPLFKSKWPLLYEDVAKDPNFKGWRAIYMKKHEEKFQYWPNYGDIVKGYVEVMNALGNHNDPMKPFKCSKFML